MTNDETNDEGANAGVVRTTKVRRTYGVTATMVGAGGDGAATTTIVGVGCSGAATAVAGGRALGRLYEEAAGHDQVGGRRGRGGGGL